MKQAIFLTILLPSAICLAQSADAPKFEIADVHVSAKTPNAYPQASPVRNGRYEIKTATMVDLIRIAYGFSADKILGGPNWIEMDRFDITAKVSPDSTPDTQKEMLQSLLEDRFKLVVRKESKPLPTYALVAGKKPLIKQAEGTEETGCKPKTSSGAGAPGENTMRIMMSNQDGVTTTIDLGPGMTIQYMCRNMTMAQFAGGIRGMMGGQAVGMNQVLDETSLKGAWNFDVKWSWQLSGPIMAVPGDPISVFEAVDKQLGLKLEERQIPTPVITVVSVNQKPSENPPGVAEALPRIPLPTEFEVASVKPSDPDKRGGNFRNQPGGRLTVENMPMRFLVSRAFDTFNNEQLVSLPKWADTERFDIIAKAPAGASGPGMNNEALAPMMRSLLVDRFKMTYHSEDRPVSTYSLVAAKPKMKKADPASRASFKNGAAPPGSPPGSQMITCQNITMAQFADRLQNMSPELGWPVVDETGIAGGWDFSLIYSRNAAMIMARAAAGRGGEGASPEGGAPAASEPTGVLTIFEAMEKQLGLKLELRKRPMPVTIIDHIEQKPTEN